MMNFYEGFEGEDCVLFSQINLKGRIIKEIEIWSGYFDTIINLIEPNSEGQWEGFVLSFHLDENWCNPTGLVIDNLELFLQQLESININYLDNVELILLSKMKELIRNCIDINLYLKISCE